MQKSRTRLAFVLTWIILTLIAQIPVLILGSAIAFEPYSMTIIEILTIILTSMAAAIVVVKEEVVDGKEIFRKE